MDKYNQAIADCAFIADDQKVKEAVDKILAENLQQNMNEEVYKFLFNCIDLTTLRSTDSPASVADFTERVNAFDAEHPEMKNVAAICVYPNFAPVVRAVLEVSSVDIACVSGGFPSSQTFPEVKVAETALAVDGGADEIAEIKDACREARLKVILEAGALKTAEKIKAASVISMYAGADFIKTSTGKEYPGADLNAAYVMCSCIKDYYEKTGRMVGFKPAGGVRTPEDAVSYYCVVKSVLGEKWLTNEYFRLGASGLANNLLTAIWGTETKFF